MSLGISASTIKSWFQYRCERKTRYELMEARERTAVPILEDEREKPWADLGINYEKRVLERLAGQQRLLRPGAGEEGLPERLAAAFLKGEKAELYAAQVNLRPRSRPQALTNVPDIQLRRTFADLVYCDRSGPTPIFQVIDIKATRKATAFHKTQVAFYARMLQAVLADLGAPGLINPVGAIWRIPDEGSAEASDWYPDTFALGPYLRLVDDFCSRTLPGIAKKRVAPELDETFFHVYFKCEQCSYLPHCIKAVDKQQQPSRRDISAVAGLSHEAKRTLQSVGVRTVHQLAGAPALRSIDGAGWSLSRRAETLVARAKAMRDNEVQRAPEPHTFLMPPRSDVALYLVADHDPVDDNLVTLGYLKVENGIATETIEVLPTASHTAEADALVTVFGRLLADLDQIDQANRNSASGVSIYSHIYFYEPSEAISLQNAVKRHLNDPRVRHGLLNMVRLFPPDDVVPEPEFRGIHHLPATALRSVVEQLYALPVSVSYDLRQVSNALYDAGLISRAYVPEQAFLREFSSLLSLEVSRELREHRRGSVDLEAVRNDVHYRLTATRAIAEWLQRENQRLVTSGERPMLRLTKKPFRFYENFDPLSAGDLDVLRAFELLENRSGLLDTLIRLAQPVHVRREAGRCAPNMRLLETRRVKRDYLLTFDAPRESQDVELGPDSLGLILTDDDPDLRLNPALWSLLGCSIAQSRPGDASTRLRVFMRPEVFEGAEFQAVLRRAGQDKWCLDQSFVDFNSNKAEAFLSFLAQDSDNAGSP